MGISKYNHEGYLDPTPYEALMAMEPRHEFRPMVFICSPYQGDVIGNVQAARKYSRFAVDTGHIPIAPHLLFPQFMDDQNPRERELGLFFGKVLMSKCMEVWVFGENITPGMQEEIKRARWKHMRIRYFNNDCEEV